MAAMDSDISRTRRHACFMMSGGIVFHRLKIALGDMAKVCHGAAISAIVGGPMTLDLESRLGPYRIVARIGAGGMGVVYRAHDEKLGRDLALKVLPPETMADETARSRLIREAHTASSLNHPRIAHIYEVGEDQGNLFIAMELI